MCSGSYSHALLIKHLLSIWAYILLNICKYNLMSTFIHLFIKCGEYFFFVENENDNLAPSTHVFCMLISFTQNYPLFAFRPQVKKKRKTIF